MSRLEAGVLESRWGTPCPPVLGLCLLSMWGVVLGPAEFRFPRPEGGVIVTLRRLLQGLGTWACGRHLAPCPAIGWSCASAVSSPCRCPGGTHSSRLDAIYKGRPW